MVFEFKLPDIGEGVHEGEIVAWKVQEGQAVKENQPIVEVMTDKATVEITSPRTGTIARILAKDGAQVKVGEVILQIQEAGAPAPPAAAAAAKPAPASAAAQEEKTLFDLPSSLLGQRRKPAAKAPVAAASAQATAAPPAAAHAALAPVENGGRVLAAPAVRRRAREMGVDLAQVAGSGPHGRIRKDDLAQFQTTAPASSAKVAAPQIALAASDERVPVRGLRKAIFENMRRSEDYAVPFTYWDSFDVTDLVKLRKDAQPLAEAQGAKLTYLPFLVKAVVAGLKQHPHVNAHMDEDKMELVVRKQFHIGVATATDRGLMVVVVKDADRKSIFQIAKEIETLSAKAREGKASREELTGSTFTITSLGKDGGLGATPVVNHPEVAILGVHKIEARPVADEKRQVVVRDMMGLSGTFDHRVIDGHIGAAFLQTVGRLLSQPNLLLLGTA